MRRLFVWLFEPTYWRVVHAMQATGMILRCSDAPNMDGMNAAAQQNAEVGREQLALAREQYADAKVRQAEFDPIYKQLIQASVDAQKTATSQSAEQWKSYSETWKPLESKLAETAANFDTPERRASEAATAAADVGQQYAAGREALNRDLGRQGLSLSGGKALALSAGSRMDEAKAAAGATATARRQVEQAGISLVDNAARFGRNMTSTGLQTAQQALSAGGQAGSQIGQQQQAIGAAYQPAMSLYGGSVGATQSAGSMLGQIASIQQQTDASNNATLGTLVGTGATLAVL